MRNKYRNGFTLIELALSMVFVGILSLAIALVITDTVASYRRGLTLNQVNTTGMDIVDDMRTAVQNSSSKTASSLCARYYSGLSNEAVKNKCEKADAYSYIYYVKKTTMWINDKREENVPIYGAFCTGTYSYLWNSGYYESDDAVFAEKNSREWATLTYNLDGVVSPVTIYGTAREGKQNDINNDKPFRLLKVRDTYRGVCASLSRPYTGTAYRDNYLTNNEIVASGFSGDFTMVGYGTVSADEPPVDIIMTDKTYDLALYDLYVAPVAESTTQKNAFYSASFILGTIGGGINILANGKSCATPSDYAAENFDYCAINKFNFAVQIGGQ